MIRLFSFATVLVFLLGEAAFAETHEVKMLNTGTDGDLMVFEPSFVQAAPGDTIKFIATDKGHNAETIGDMIPDGGEQFRGRINEEIEVTLSEEGLYGVKCQPHYAMGMVMTIAVGNVEAPDDYLEGRIPPQSKARFEQQLSNL